MKYALRNIFRHPHRTLMMLLVLVTVLVLLMWSVLTAALCSSAIDSYQNRQSDLIEMKDGNALTPKGEIPINMKFVERVDEAFDIVTEVYAYWMYTAELPETDPLPGTSDSDQKSGNWKTHRVYFCTDMSVTPDIVDGRIEMIEGEPITQADYDAAVSKIVISQELATRNGYQLGDTLKMYLQYERGGAQYAATFPLTISGIYRVNEKTTGIPEHCYQITANDLYIPMSVFWTAMKAENIFVFPKAVYYEVENPDAQTVERLEERVRAMFNKGISLEITEPDVVTEGIAKLLMLARAAAILLSICGLTAFLVMLLLNLQSRTGEFGILTALGKKTRHTANVFFCEVALIAVVALLLAVFLFGWMADAGVEMIRSFLTSEVLLKEQQNSTMQSFLTLQLVAEDPIDILPSLRSALGIAIGAAGLVIVVAYVMIRVYLKRVNLMRVLRGGNG